MRWVLKGICRYSERHVCICTEVLCAYICQSMTESCTYMLDYIHVYTKESIYLCARDVCTH